MKKLSLCKFDTSNVCVDWEEQYPFRMNDKFIYLGDIPNMPHHCVLVRYVDGKVFCGYHTEDFVELKEDEV